MKTPSKYHIEVTSATYTGDDLADYLENGPLYRDDEGTASDVTCEVAALRAENERLRNAIEIEREGQRSMARALSEINRLSRLGVAINLARFGAALLPKWWDDGNPGDIDGADAQDAAEACGLWHRVERHADGVECEWCNNEEPCGELTEAGLAALAARGGE